MRFVRQLQAMFLLLCLAMAFIYAGEFQVDSNTFALYHFNEGSGATLYDSSGHGYNGTLTGCTWVTGLWGTTALSFNGTSDNVVVNQGVPVRNVSFELWFKPDTSYVYKGSATQPGFTFAHFMLGLYGAWSSGLTIDSAQDSIYFWTGTTYSPVVAASAKIARANLWNYIAATIDNTDTVRLYLNGQFISKAHDTNATRNWSRFYFGANYYTNTCSFFHGTIDEARISNTVRTASAISSYWTSANLPNAPTLLSPSNGAGNQPNSLNITWSTVASALSYSVVVSTSTSFVTTVAKQLGITGTSISLSSLAYGTTYYWEAEATNADGSSSSPIWSFTTISVPIAPTLSSPTNATNVQLTTTLSWSSVLTATSYRVQFSNSSSFTLVNDTTLATTSRVASSLSGNSLYYWRVYATNSAGSSAWSTVWSFTTINSPVAPTLSSPANGTSNALTNTILIWNTVGGASSYNVQLSNTSTFSLRTDTLLVSADWPVLSLSNGTQYFWEVNATNAAGTSGWSSIWSFTTISTSVLTPNDAAISKKLSISNSGIVYNLAAVSRVSVTLYDIQGRLVRQLLNTMQNAGSYTVDFKRAKITAGFYIVKFKAGSFIAQKRLALMN